MILAAEPVEVVDKACDADVDPTDKASAVLPKSTDVTEDAFTPDDVTPPNARYG